MCGLWPIVRPDKADCHWFALAHPTSCHAPNQYQIGSLNGRSVGLGSQRVVGIAAGLWYHLTKEWAVCAEQ